MKCPRCGKDYDEYPALSRYANVDICPQCGLEEAMFPIIGIENDFSNWVDYKEEEK